MGIYWELNLYHLILNACNYGMAEFLGTLIEPLLGVILEQAYLTQRSKEHKPYKYVKGREQTNDKPGAWFTKHFEKEHGA